MSFEYGYNADKPIIEVYHSKLSLFAEETSSFRAECPVCDRGLLLIYRNPKNMKLQRVDRCISCAQQFKYLDDKIAGEDFE